MSSSEDDTIVIPVKRIRRRNYASSNKSTFKQINLYSQKVLPALNKVNRTIPQQISEGMSVLFMVNTSRLGLLW